MSLYSIYAARRKYELVDPTTYSVINYNEADLVLEGWKSLADKAQDIYDSLPEDTHPSFFQLVLHPILAGYTLYQLHIDTAKNNLYAVQRRTSANLMAKEVLTQFGNDVKLTSRYHALLGGKWRHMMDQTHIGCDSWLQPMRNTCVFYRFIRAISSPN